MFREEGRRGGKKNIDGREKHQLVASPTHPDWGSNPQIYGVQNDAPATQPGPHASF